MNQEITGITGSNKLLSKPRASMEATSQIQKNELESTQEAKEVRQFKIEMEEIKHAFALVKEIRESLEETLKNLSPSE